MNDGITPISILLVRGNINDHRHTDDRLRLRRLANVVHPVEGPANALRLLTTNIADGELPGFIVLDLNDGDNDTLVSTIRDEAALAEIPLVVLTDRSLDGIDLRPNAPLTQWLSRPASLADITHAVGVMSDLSFEVTIVSHVRWHETQMWIRSKSPAIDLSELSAKEAYSA
jgi:hypothetical protein